MLIVVVVIAILFAALLIFLTATEYKPEAVETLATPEGTALAAPGDELTLVTMNTGYWAPGVIGNDVLPDGFRFAVDDSLPTCRLLSAPYTEQSQMYVIDGFIVSPNVQVKTVETIATDFENSDHQPVRMEVTLSPAA